MVGKNNSFLDSKQFKVSVLAVIVILSVFVLFNLIGQSDEAIVGHAGGDADMASTLTDLTVDVDLSGDSGETEIEIPGLTFEGKELCEDNDGYWVGLSEENTCFEGVCYDKLDFQGVTCGDTITADGKYILKSSCVLLPGAGASHGIEILLDDSTTEVLLYCESGDTFRNGLSRGSPSGIYVRDSSSSGVDPKVTIVGCGIEGFTNGVYLSGVSDSEFAGLTVTDSEEVGIYANGGSDNNFCGNSIQDSGTRGVYFYQTEEPDFQENVVYGSGLYGVYFSEVYAFDLRDNVITSSAADPSSSSSGSEVYIDSSDEGYFKNNDLCGLDGAKTLTCSSSTGIIGDGNSFDLYSACDENWPDLEDGSGTGDYTGCSSGVGYGSGAMSGTFEIDLDRDNFGSVGSGGLDCDDSDALVNPDATEICSDGVDNDCDSITSDDISDGFCSCASGESMYYVDLDVDGYGAGTVSCQRTGSPGYSEYSTDCDDSDFDVNPGATEACDSVDNDCDGTVDEDDVCGSFEIIGNVYYDDEVVDDGVLDFDDVKKFIKQTYGTS